MTSNTGRKGPASPPPVDSPDGAEAESTDLGAEPGRGERLPAARPPAGGPPWARMGQPGEKPMTFGPSAKRLIARLSPEIKRVYAVIALAVASIVLTVIGPLLLGFATDVIFAGVLGAGLPDGISTADAAAEARADGNESFAALIERMDVVPGVGIDFAALRDILLLTIVLFALASLLSLVQGRLLNTLVQRTVFRLRSDVENKLNRLPLQYFDRQQRGEILSRVTNDIDNVSQSLQQTLSQLLTSLLMVIGVLVMMFVVSPLLAIVALVTIPVSMLLTKAIASRSQRQFIAQWRHTGALNGQIEEAFSGHELVKVFGRQREVEATFAAKNEELYAASFRAQFVSGIIMPAMMFLGNVNYVLIAVIGGLRVASGGLSLGEVQAFIQYSRQFTQPLTQLASMANLLQSGVASAERVFELLDAEEHTPDPAHPAEVGTPRGEVVFDHVRFSYDADNPLIEDLSLTAAPGQTIAIVGPTGAGKTTLVNLIMRFYELDGGRITLDGVDIATMRRSDLRAEIGMVLQDTWLFGGTIRDNIAYGDPTAGEEAIMAAARAAYVDRFVRSLPDGYDTVIDEDGGNISAGQMQLITIARAFLADPALLILDEATSSVDTRTEVLVQEAMAALRSDRTSFVIAHRLSTIRDADLILVMESGQIVEQGSHESLLAADGAYARLYNAQFAAPVAEALAPVG